MCSVKPAQNNVFVAFYAFNILKRQNGALYIGGLRYEAPDQESGNKKTKFNFQS